MCIIIDANFASEIFNNPTNGNNSPVVHWLFDADKNGVVVFGGKLAQELLLMRVVSRSLRTLLQAGRAIYVDDSKVNLEEQQVVRAGLCQSNDAHVIALAHVSGARTLCSHDEALHDDFKNKRLVDKPRGRIYQNSTHSNLLKHTSGCGRK